MKREISPGLVALVIGVIAVVVVVIGIKVLGHPSYQPEKAGGQKEMENYQKTGEFYKPPAEVPGIRTGPGGGTTLTGPAGIPTGPPGGGTTGGYNLRPPSH